MKSLTYVRPKNKKNYPSSLKKKKKIKNKAKRKKKEMGKKKKKEKKIRGKRTAYRWDIHFENEKVINLEMWNDRIHISSLGGTSESLYAVLILFRY